MAWPPVPKGRPKPEGAGRKKGTPNKITASLREDLKAKNFDVAEQIVKLFEDAETSNRDRVDLLKLVLEFTQYKPSAPKEPENPTFQANNIQVAMMRQSTAELESAFIDPDLEREFMADED
tara:strand:- start:68 stop:430 length:363 start_codon:yes stop_codon:yes gene_type:complete